MRLIKTVDCELEFIISRWVAHYYGCPMNTKRRERSSPPGESCAMLHARLPSTPPPVAAAVHLSLPATVAGGRSSEGYVGVPPSVSVSAFCVCDSPMGALSPPAACRVVGSMGGDHPPAAWSCCHLYRGGCHHPECLCHDCLFGGVGRHPRTLPSKLSITMRRLLAVEGRHPRSTTTSSLPLWGGGGRHPRPRVLVSLRGRHPRLRMGIIAHIIIKGKSIR